MSNIRIFLTSVSHLNGDGFDYAAVCVDLDKLASLAKGAMASLETLTTPDNLWGNITLSGFSCGILFNFDGVLEEGLLALVNESDEKSETPIEITEEQYDALAAIEDAAGFDGGGFQFNARSIYSSCFPRKGEGEAVSRGDFLKVLQIPESVAA